MLKQPLRLSAPSSKNICIHAGQCEQNPTHQQEAYAAPSHTSLLSCVRSIFLYSIFTRQEWKKEPRHEPIRYIASFSLQQQARMLMCLGQQPVTRMRQVDGALLALYQGDKKLGKKACII